MKEPIVHLPVESRGEAGARGRLPGRRVLVVGGGQEEYGMEDPPIGNGRAMSVLFAREGARVAVADRNLEAAESTCRVIAAEGGNAFPIRADVRNPEEIEAMVQEADSTAGGLDGLVYNVGIGGEMLLQNVTAEGWDQVLSVNLRGAALALKAALPRMPEGSSVVLISSTASLRPGSRIPAYDSSKAALAGLMRHAAFEASRRCIRVNVVAPGLMDTALGRLATKARPSRAKAPIPLGRQGTGWETAYASLFLISEESAYVTGQVLGVDGGIATLR
jgi:NAD(P)-dependent dehydrogenase (short-subunit alcohol dehydrogenase family)